MTYTFRNRPLDHAEVGGEALLGDGVVCVERHGEDAGVGHDPARGILSAVAADVLAHCRDRKERAVVSRANAGSLRVPHVPHAATEQHQVPF